MARDLLKADDPVVAAAVAAGRRELVAVAVKFKATLMQAGLVQTHRQMDRVTRMIGYEIAALESGTWPVEDLRFLEVP